MSVDEKILNELAKLGDRKFSEDSITFEGTRLVVPSSMSAQGAVDALVSHIDAEEKTTQFDRKFKYRPWDVAAATARAIKELTGMSGVGIRTFSFFGSTPPEMKTINVSHDEVMQVPWGNLYVPLFDGTLTLSSTRDPEYGMLGVVYVECRKKHRHAVNGLFKLIENQLETASIYRGKAFNGAEDPEFIDLGGIDETQIVYTEEVMSQLEANVWAPLRYTQALKDNGVPLKRSVLLTGPYGTGKTLGAFLTAKEAGANGWTFVYCRPGQDDLSTVMQTARLYEPAVVFFEDVDTISSSDDTDTVTKLLDTFDGITAKGTELMVLLTTNHPEKIHKGMVRPGRLDAVIQIGSLDRSAFEKLIKATVAEELLGDIDFDKVAEAMTDFLPAFVRESIDRTKRYAIARTGGTIDELTTDDFVNAAVGLRPQLDMMNGAEEGTGPVPLERALSNTIASVIRGELDVTHIVDDSDDPVLYLAKS